MYKTRPAPSARGPPNELVAPFALEGAQAVIVEPRPAGAEPLGLSLTRAQERFRVNHTVEEQEVSVSDCAFFDTFGIIHAITQGGPANATTILVYKVFNDGFVGLDLGGSAAQSVILMAIVIAMTVIQFRFVEKRVQY